MSDQSAEDIIACSVGEYHARLKLCGLSFVSHAGGNYLLFQDIYGNDVTVRRPEDLTQIERIEAIESYERQYPPAGRC